MGDELYEDWTIPRRETLKPIYLLILTRLADCGMTGSNYWGCIVYCQKTLNKGPCREDIYQRLMCCYSRMGQGNRVLQWHQTCRKIIQSELNTTPDSE